VEANEYRANLLVRVAAAYEFQVTNAEKQPKDGRYQASADALYKLYHALEAIALDDPRLVACYRLEMIEWDGPVDDISCCFTREVENLTGPLIARYGLDRPEGGDLERFLDAYRDVLQRSLRKAHTTLHR
jgi:hypothetical protein